MNTLNAAENDIEVENLDFAYRQSERPLVVLENVSFKVPRGTMFCIVGPSGCGKTTLLRILLGDYSATAGTVYIKEERARSGLAYIPQEPRLFPWRTLLQNAALGLEMRGRVNPRKLVHVQHLISDFRLSGFEKCKPRELSGGMQQRTSVIRALASQPEILLCDEPFSAVDFVTRLELNTLFKKMCKISAITTVFVTHNIEEALFLGDTIAVMSKRPGRILQFYRPELSVHPEDAVKCRQSPEFQALFEQIWRSLE